MLCEICKKNSATIHIQEVMGDTKKSLHLCADCAAKTPSENPIFEGINIAEMLYNISEDMEMGNMLPPQEQEAHEDIASLYICEKCGWDTQDFKKTGRLGCPECYKTFDAILSESLPNMHKATVHKGKSIRSYDVVSSKKNTINQKKVIENLQKELEECVKREEYEKAAVLRDKINQLKSV